MFQSRLVGEWHFSWAWRLWKMLSAAVLLGLPALLLLIKHPVPWLPWLAWGLATIFTGAFALNGLYDAFSHRIRLYDDRLVLSARGHSRTIWLRDVRGVNVTGDVIRIILKDDAGDPVMWVVGVIKDPGILAWIESLEKIDAKDLDLEDLKAEIAEREEDERRDAAVAEGRAAGVAVSLVGVALHFAGIGLGIWAIFLPRPFEVVASLCAFAPLVAILLVLWRPKVIRLMNDEKDTYAVGLNGLWIMPPLGLAILALRYSMIDPLAAILPASAAAILFFVASLMADRQLRRPGDMFFAALISCAWGWGGAVIAKVWFG